MKLIRGLFTIACLSIYVCSASISYAAPTDFSVKALIPNNQLDKRQTYFDLKMTPKQNQDIQVRIDNHTNKKITIIPSVINATTTIYGDINYTDEKAKPDESMKFPLTSIAKTAHVLTLNSRKSKLLNLHLTMPEEKQNGVILGGIHFIEKSASSANTESQSAIQIKNQYAYVIGLKLNEGKPVQPDLHFKSIKLYTLNNRKVVTVNIQNSKAVIVHDLSVKTQIRKVGAKKILQSDVKKNMRMAPNSNFDMPIIWNAAGLKAGKYDLHLSATANGKNWTADRTFVIKGQEAAAVNHNSLPAASASLYKWLGGAFLMVLVAVVFYLLGKRQKNR